MRIKPNVKHIFVLGCSRKKLNLRLLSFFCGLQLCKTTYLFRCYFASNVRENVCVCLQLEIFSVNVVGFGLVTGLFRTRMRLGGVDEPVLCEW